MALSLLATQELGGPRKAIPFLTSKSLSGAGWLTYVTDYLGQYTSAVMRCLQSLDDRLAAQSDAWTREAVETSRARVLRGVPLVLAVAEDELSNLDRSDVKVVLEPSTTNLDLHVTVRGKTGRLTFSLDFDEIPQ